MILTEKAQGFVGQIRNWFTVAKDDLAALTEETRPLAREKLIPVFRLIFESVCDLSPAEYNATIVELKPEFDFLQAKGLLPEWVGQINESEYRSRRETVGCPAPDYLPSATGDLVPAGQALGPSASEVAAGAAAAGTAAPDLMTQIKNVAVTAPGWAWAVVGGTAAVGAVAIASWALSKVNGKKKRR